MKKILLFAILTLSILTLKAQTLYFGGSGSWTGSVWNTSNASPYMTTWVSGRAAEFNIPNSTVTYSTTVVSGIIANENVTVTSGGTFGTGGNIIDITVAAGKTFNFGSQAISTSSGTGFIKKGTGELAISAGGAYNGGVTLNSGTLILGGVNALGNGGTLNINGGNIAGSSSSKDFSTKIAAININTDFIIGGTTGLALNTANLVFDAPINLGNSSKKITLNGSGNNTFSGIISGIDGGIEIGSGSTGILILSGVNTYTGGTKISGGTLLLGASDVIPNASMATLNGGTLKSGVTSGVSTGFSDTFSTLVLTDNSIIALGTGQHTLTFSASNTTSWTTGKTLTITGWTGISNNTGTAGKIFFGSDATGLNAAQLSQIKFFNGTVNTDATILSTGEIVSTGTLPIQLTSFTGKAINQSILLNWITASEINNDYYDVLRSSDGKYFSSIGTTKGAGTSTIAKDYMFSDENPYAGTNYYQLVQHGFNGKTTSSTIISVNSKIDAAKLSVYASGSNVKVSVSSPNKTKARLQIFDFFGRKLAEHTISVNKGFNHFNLPLILPNAIHFARYTSDNEVINHKFVK